jgi:hypothetical protein
VSDLVRIAPLTEEEQAFLQAALQFIESRASKKTRQGYRKDLERWVRFAQVRNFRLHSAPLIAAALFRDQLFEAGLKPTSARRVLASLSSVYKNVIKLSPERPLTSGNPFSPDRLQWPVASKKGQTPAMKHRDARALIAAAADDAGDLGRRDEASKAAGWRRCICPATRARQCLLGSKSRPSRRIFSRPGIPRERFIPTASMNWSSNVLAKPASKAATRRISFARRSRPWPPTPAFLSGISKPQCTTLI